MIISRSLKHLDWDNCIAIKAKACSIIHCISVTLLVAGQEVWIASRVEVMLPWCFTTVCKAFEQDSSMLLVTSWIQRGRPDDVSVILLYILTSQLWITSLSWPQLISPVIICRISFQQANILNLLPLAVCLQPTCAKWLLLSVNPSL